VEASILIDQKLGFGSLWWYNLLLLQRLAGSYQIAIVATTRKIQEIIVLPTKPPILAVKKRVEHQELAPLDWVPLLPVSVFVAVVVPWSADFVTIPMMIGIGFFTDRLIWTTNHHTKPTENTTQVK
jgi:hypothetical protein